MRASRYDAPAPDLGVPLRPSTVPRRALLVVSTCFATIIASVNIINPLLPDLQRQLGLSAAANAGLYSIYLVVLVLVLAGLAVRPLQYDPKHVLIVALMCTVLADLCHALGGLPEIAAGRALLSLGVGLGTPAAAQLALDLSEGRLTSITATANVSGAFLGTAAGGAVLRVAAQPLHAGFVAHATVVVVLLALLALYVPASEAPSTASSADERRAGDPPASAKRRVMAGLALGSVSWIAAGAVIVVAPAAALSAGADVGPWLAPSVLAMFAAAFCSQHTLGRSARGLSITGPVILVAMGVVVASVLVAEPWVLLGAGVLVGLGYGATLRIGLEIVSQASGSLRESRAASLYAGWAYLSAGSSMVAGGALVDAWGGLAAMVFVSGLVTVGLLVALIAGRPSIGRTWA